MPGYHAFRLPDAYRALLSRQPADFAWEWLRRNPDYRALWAHVGAAAARASAQAAAAARRHANVLTTLPQHPLGRRSARLGLTFPFTAIDIGR